MQAASVSLPQRLHYYRFPMPADDALREIQEGFAGSPKRIHPKYFYDERGSLLFDAITEQPEYYPTRAEKEILRRFSPAISARLGGDVVVIEPGSGTSEKAEQLLPALQPQAYVPLDIAAIHVRDAGHRLAHRFPWLNIHAIAADYCNLFDLPAALPDGRRVIFYPGSTIGNFEPDAAVGFLARCRKMAGDEGSLLIGVDLEKDHDILHAAYNDKAGVTANFNLNVLRHINRLADADFDLSTFGHVAFYNSRERRIEMHLESRQTQQVRCGDQTFGFEEGERIHTENSYKYTVERFTKLARSAGWEMDYSWQDHDHLFSLNLLRAM